MGERFIHDNIDGCWELRMKLNAEILDDEELSSRLRSIKGELRHSGARSPRQLGLLSIHTCRLTTLGLVLQLKYAFPYFLRVLELRQSEVSTPITSSEGQAPARVRAKKSSHLCASRISRR
jgi:hypothetical protein